MKYRAGLDLGTASIGLAAFSLDNNSLPFDLVWKSIRIFDEPLDNSTAGLQSKKAARRAARMQRRQIDRRRGRNRRIVALASLLNLSDFRIPRDGGQATLELRARAARERIELDELLRVFLRMSKRRGYAGEFRQKKEGAKVGEVEGGSNDLKDAMTALAKERGLETVTLGEYLHQRWMQGLPTKLKVKENRTDESSDLPNLYALRSQVEAEFEQVWANQAGHHAILNSELDGKPIKAAFQEAIFHQRPLKSVGGMVGQCPLEPTLPRAPRAQPTFQRFRIEKTLADLRWGAGKRATTLSREQKDVIRALLDEKETVSFKVINNALKKAGHPGPEGRGLNMDRISREEIHGNKTNTVFRKLGLEQEWKALEARTQIQVINFLADLGSPEQLDDPLWHTRFVRCAKTARKDAKGNWIYEDKPRQFESAFIGFINLLKENEKFDRLPKMGFDGGRASYSIKALSTLADWIAEPWWEASWQGEKRIDEEAAVRTCYSHILKQNTQQLPHLNAPAPTGNDVVDGALRQLHREFNRMIDVLGAPPHELVVELAREMGVGVKKRNEREAENAKNRTARLNAEKAIRAAGASVTPPRVRRYLLWREQSEGLCPYCTRKIELGDALSSIETEYEHILPKNLTQVGLKRSEIVLAHRSCNHEKGDRTPWEAWGNSKDPDRWNIIEQRAAWFEKSKQYRKAKLLLLKDFETEVLTDESIAEFADRQFHQTSWIAKEAAKWLQSVCATPVSVARGGTTALLRRGWKLETVIPQVRIEEGLPVLAEEEIRVSAVDGKEKKEKTTPVISTADFEKYRKLWEGHPSSKELHTDLKLNKRIDHRHHLIDAITIALTSRALFQQMAHAYKQESEKPGETRRVRLHAPEPPVKNLRELALAAVRACPLSIKPDRFPSGQIFQGTAYGIAQKDGESKSRLSLRMELARMIDRKKGTADQARKAIVAIISPVIRKAVSETFESRIAQGKSAPAALSEPIYQSAFGKPVAIKRVVCFTDKYADDVMLIRHTSSNGKQHDKRLLHSGYAWLDTEFSEGRIVRQELVTIQQAMRQKGKPKAERVLRLHKGDIVLDSKDNKQYRIGYFTAEGNVFLIPHIDPRAFDAIKEVGSGKKKLSFGQVKRLSIIN
jgi:CRISPR-associated endonuclease Csn1